MGVGGTCGTGHLHLDELGRALAVLDHLLRQIQHHHMQCRREIAGGLGPHILQRRGLGLARRRQDQRVRGRGVAVHRDRVERLIHLLRQHLLQVRGRNFRISEDIDEHRGHIRRDHARTLGNPGDMDQPAIALHHCTRTLGEGVGGHDGAGRSGNPTGFQLARHLTDHGGDARDRQRLADHPGRG